MKAVILNAKGFGGNNASGLVLSPAQTLTMLEAKHGSKVVSTYLASNAAVRANAVANDAAACLGSERIRYDFGGAVMDDEGVKISQTEVQLSSFQQSIPLAVANPYADYAN
jgi:acetoacetyl-[acyl-carrier protein] synthase